MTSHTDSTCSESTTRPLSAGTVKSLPISITPVDFPARRGKLHSGTVCTATYQSVCYRQINANSPGTVFTNQSYGSGPVIENSYFHYNIIKQNFPRLKRSIVVLLSLSHFFHFFLVRIIIYKSKPLYSQFKGR